MLINLGLCFSITVFVDVEGEFGCSAASADVAASNAIAIKKLFIFIVKRQPVLNSRQVMKTIANLSFSACFQKSVVNIGCRNASFSVEFI